MNVDWRAVVVLVVGLTVTGASLAVATEANPPPKPFGITPALRVIDNDSVQFTATWHGAARANSHVVSAGDSAETWLRQVEVQGNTATLWIPVTEDPQPAWICVVGVNRSPFRGRQMGNALCEGWVVPADVLPPGTPDSIRIIPDTVGMALMWQGLDVDGVLPIRSLGENAVGLSIAGVNHRGETFACVRAPDGRIGWVNATVVDGWKIWVDPHTGFIEEPGCVPQVEVVGTDPGAVSSDFLNGRIYDLPVWPQDLHVVVWDEMVRVFAHRETDVP